MNNPNEINEESSLNEKSISKSETNSDNISNLKIDGDFGVLHDENGNIIKIAENAVPPKAWKDQKKAYNDAWENNKNQSLEDEI